MNSQIQSRVIVLISANTEWKIVCRLFDEPARQTSPLGEWFLADIPVRGKPEPVRFLHGGWGKIAAAASTQYAIDHWGPALLVNLGTCGGFQGAIEKGTILLVERTLVYDIYEQMADQAAHLAHYTTDLDLSWLGESYPQPVRRSLLVSGDRDIVAGEIPRLKRDFGAVAADWESAAIAYVAARNGARCLILRGVSDLVSEEGGEAYDGNIQHFVAGATRVLSGLIEALPAWLALALPETTG